MSFPKIERISDNILLSQRLVGQLRAMIIEGALQPGTQLPNENQLAEKLKVSRSTIRSALQTLEKSGFVIKKRGIGTFVSDEPLTANNLSLNWGVTQVIRSMDAIPGTVDMQVYQMPADDLVAERLHIRAGSPVLLVERVRTANARRVVFTLDYIPFELLTGIESDPVDKIKNYLEENQSLYVFMARYLSKSFHHAIARISPSLADENMAATLNIPLGSGILYLESVDYTRSGDPLWMSKEYHVANAFTFTVYRGM
jgi:GntR family transcriptional regulator